MKRKDLLGIKDLSKSELNEILQSANAMRETIDRRERLTTLAVQRVARYRPPQMRGVNTYLVRATREKFELDIAVALEPLQNFVFGGHR